MLSGSGGVVAPGAIRGPVVAQSVDPSVLVDTPTLRAVVVFVLVVAVGGAVLYRSERFVSRSVKSSADSPVVSAIYGLAAHGMVAFAAGVATSQMASVGVTQPVLQLGTMAAFGVVLLGLGGLGFAVVGTWVTGVLDHQRPWEGLVAVAAVLAVGALVLPLLLAAGLWLFLASVGVGGPTRKWVHAEHTAASGD